MIQVKKSDGRSEKARLTRGRILDAAGELFVRDGYGATALQDIATKAGCAVQTIYAGTSAVPGRCSKEWRRS